MRILVALDTNAYSHYVAHEVGKMAINTWSDITLLGVYQPKDHMENIEEMPLAKQLLDYRDIITSYYPKSECPYSREGGNEFTKVDDNIYITTGKGGLKTLKVVLRKGSNYVNEIIKQAEEDESTLIIIGCNKEDNCKWQFQDVPAKIGYLANCSVFIVKEKKDPKQIVCCLDQEYITQNSLELINQMVTLYKAELRIVGISQGGGLKIKVENTLKNLFMYYLKQDIPIWLEVIDSSVLPNFIEQVTQDSLIAIWVGQKSFLKKLFPDDKITKLINTAPSSLLLLR